MSATQNNLNDTHVSTRIDKDLKKDILDAAERLERRPANVLARVIELGWPLYQQQYLGGPSRRKKSETKATA